MGNSTTARPRLAHLLWHHGGRAAKLRDGLQPFLFWHLLLRSVSGALIGHALSDTEKNKYENTSRFILPEKYQLVVSGNDIGDAFVRLGIFACVVAALAVSRGKYILQININTTSWEWRRRSGRHTIGMAGPR